MTAGRLAARAAFVTGAGRGIGRAIAEAFVREGARVAVADLDGAAAEKAARELGQAAVAVRLDVTDPEAARGAVDSFAESAGGLDILVNNAGIAWDAPLAEMKDALWDAVLRVNLYGAFHCTRPAVRHMVRKRWGRILNLSSIVGAYGEPNQANYAASKGGIVSFTKTVAKEVASRGITANAIAPGFIVTPLTDQMPKATRDFIVGIVPLGRAGVPADIASAAVFLASEEAGYITGQVLHVNGGLLI